MLNMNFITLSIVFLQLKKKYNVVTSLSKYSKKNVSSIPFWCFFVYVRLLARRATPSAADLSRQRYNDFTIRQINVFVKKHLFTYPTK